MPEGFNEWFYGGKSRHFGHNTKTSPGPKPSKGGNGKKGRDRKKCERYRAEGRRESNKLRHLTLHLRRFPNDGCARVAVGRLGGRPLLTHPKSGCDIGDNTRSPGKAHYDGSEDKD